MPHDVQPCTCQDSGIMQHNANPISSTKAKQYITGSIMQHNVSALGIVPEYRHSRVLSWLLTCGYLAAGLCQVYHACSRYHTCSTIYTSPYSVRLPSIRRALNDDLWPAFTISAHNIPTRRSQIPHLQMSSESWQIHDFS